AQAPPIVPDSVPEALRSTVQRFVQADHTRRPAMMDTLPVLQEYMRSMGNRCCSCDEENARHQLSYACSHKLCSDCIAAQIESRYMSMPADQWPAKCDWCVDESKQSIVHIDLINRLVDMHIIDS